MANFIKEDHGIEVVPVCKTLGSAAAVNEFMDAHGFDEIVLKTRSDACGQGIFRVFRDAANRLMVEQPDKIGNTHAFGPPVIVLDDAFFEGQDMLAMEWMDNSQGDIRAIIVNGSCIGAYRRDHAEDTWLCNYAQGGRIGPVDLYRDLSREDRKLINATAKTLRGLGMDQVSIDLLANKNGQRKLSEINIGNTDDLVEISRHWDDRNTRLGRLSFAEQWAADIFAEYQCMIQEEALHAQHEQQTRSI